MTNTVDVTAGGALAEPVQLHRPVYAEWLANPDYNSWTNYTDGGVHHEFPMITQLVWDTPENAIYMQNLYPGRTYEWAVTNNGTVVKSGSFTTAATPPRWLIANVSSDRNVNNFRDLGGWELPGGNGRRTKFDVFFRSANFDAYFESGDIRDKNPMHAEFGINTELDLRGGENIATLTVDPDAGIEGERYYFERPHNKVEQVIGLGPTNSFNTSPSVADGSVRYFRVEMIVDITHRGSSAGEEIRKAFHVLGTKSYHPVLFHCAAGRDRTGYIAFLLEGLCGLREEQLYRDHLSIVFAAQGAMWSERLDGNIRDLYTSREHDGTFSYASYGDSLAGHIRAYLKSLGVTDEEIATITQAYTGETPDEVLARVQAFETANQSRTVWFMSKETHVTNAVHRVGRGEALHPPLFGRYDHQAIYKLERPGYRFIGWSEEKPIPGSSDTCIEALWESRNPGPGAGVSAWLYDAESMTVSDGAWMLGVTAEGAVLTVTNVYSAPDEPSELDLSKPIITADGAAGSYSFVRIASGDPRNCLFGLAAQFRDQVNAVRFPSGLTEIGSCAFTKCTNLTGRVTLPDGLSVVSTNCFSESGVHQIVLPESCTRINHNAFYRCKALTNIVVGTQLKVLEYGAFNEASALASFSPGFPTSLETIGEYAFFGTSLGGDLRMPYVDAIPYKCFSGVSVTSLYIPAVTNVGREAVTSDLLTNVTFGAKAVSFIDFHDANRHVGYSSFRTANPCRFIFPGKAPLLPKTGEGTTGSYTGSTSGSIFGIKSNSKVGGFALLCGSWNADPAGWQKIMDEVGAPVSDVTYAPPAQLPDGWSVKGIFRFATSSTSTNYGWLVDNGFTGGSVTVEDVTIPEAWMLQFPGYTEKFGSDFAASLLKETGKQDAAGNPLKVWHDYVMGTDPTDLSDRLTALIEMGDGSPRISYTPALSDRKYTIWGTPSLKPAAWSQVTEGSAGACRFFKVTVEMK